MRMWCGKATTRRHIRRGTHLFRVDRKHVAHRWHRNEAERRREEQNAVAQERQVRIADDTELQQRQHDGEQQAHERVEDVLCDPNGWGQECTQIPINSGCQRMRFGSHHCTHMQCGRLVVRHAERCHDAAQDDNQRHDAGDAEPLQLERVALVEAFQFVVLEAQLVPQPSFRCFDGVIHFRVCECGVGGWQKR